MMAVAHNTRYWLFQALGWGAFGIANLFFAVMFSADLEKAYLHVLFTVELGIIISHLMRYTIRKNHVLLRPVNQQVLILAVLTLLYAFFYSAVQSPFDVIISRYPRDVRFEAMFGINFSSNVLILFFWNSVYFMYHYILKSRKQQMETLQLEALVKSLELKTIKAHINPHFIFNSLNSIRALIDENPARARSAVTELSNILRSSLNAEKSETVNLSDELKIVQDYLALEHMRFEDRLNITYEISDETMSLPVPPMMLQTLVENAIKHGISKRISGGTVKVQSGLRGHYHILTVTNTGVLQPAALNSGFGISSTQDRLFLVFGQRARFELLQTGAEQVEARVKIPLTTKLIQI